jgi:ribosome recycling factor
MNDEQPAENIGSYLDPSAFDELPKDIEAAISETADEETSGQTIPAPVLSDERRKQMVQDLDHLNEQATAMFRKADFDKMLGEAALKKSEEIINQIYSELEKKNIKNQSNTETP